MSAGETSSGSSLGRFSGPGHVAAVLVQVALAAWVLSLAPYSWRPWTFFAYYAGLVVLIPTLAAFLADGALTPGRRVVLAGGLAMHPFAFFYDLYGTLWWWDIPAHFISAVLLAAGGYAAALAYREVTGSRFVSGWRIHALVLVLVVTGGVAWEVYELLESYLVVHGPVDTAKDLVVDVVGWAFVARFHRRVLGGIPAGFVRWFRGHRFEHANRPRKISRRP